MESPRDDLRRPVALETGRADRRDDVVIGPAGCRPSRPLKTSAASTGAVVELDVARGGAVELR
ncbi:MAG: hypothetical protein MZV64_22835 [Ignavibacteriales bacterium]|nr:hypothetical protein [Ignavibacteriales bacterium]